jgi:hypothetical protein
MRVVSAKQPLEPAFQTARASAAHRLNAACNCLLVKRLSQLWVLDLLVSERRQRLSKLPEIFHSLGKTSLLPVEIQVNSCEAKSKADRVIEYVLMSYFQLILMDTRDW